MNLTGSPNEAIILNAMVTRLASTSGAAYFYDADSAFLIDGAQLKHLAECADGKTLYLVEPGLVTVQPDTGCKRLFSGDAIVTAAQRIGGHELPWETGYVAPALVKLKLFGDILTALDRYSVTLNDGDAIHLFVADRNLSIREADGWAIVQSQIRFEWSEVYS